MPSFIKLIAPAERAPLYLSHQAWVRGHNKVNAFISGDSRKALTRFITVHPDLARELFTSIRTLEKPGMPVPRIFFPERLNEVPLKLLHQLVSDRAALARCLTPKGLDLRKAEVLKRTYIDLTLQFEEIQIIKESLEALYAVDKESLKKSPYFSLVVLYDSLLDVSDVLYIAGGEKGTGKLEGDATAFSLGRTQLILVKEFLRDLLDHFPFEMFPEYRRAISNPEASDKGEKRGLIELLEAGNNPAAGPKYDALLRDIEKRLYGMDRARAKKESRTRLRPPRDLLGEEILRLAKRKYNMEFLPGGIWLIPQDTYKKKDGFDVKERVPHQVPEDSVLRRNEHIIENVVSEIAANLEFRGIFDGFAEALIAGKVSLKLVIAELDRAYENYKAVKVFTKKEVRARVQRALRQLQKARQPGRHIDARSRLIRNAAIMLKQACHYLDQRIEEQRTGQLPSLKIKGEVEETIIVQKLRRDSNLRRASNQLLNGLRVNKVAWTPTKLEEMRQIAAEAGQELKDAIEPGLIRCRGRIGELVKQIAKLRRLVIEKRQLLKELKDLLQKIINNYEIYEKKLKAGHSVEIDGQPVTLEKLRAACINAIARRLSGDKGLTWHVREIKQTLLLVIKEAFLITYDVENKYSEAAPASEELKPIWDILEEVERRDTDFVMAISRGKDPQPLGVILRRDAQELDLRRAELEVWERYLKWKEKRSAK